jgi:hypothetical protein
VKRKRVLWAVYLHSEDLEVGAVHSLDASWRVRGREARMTLRRMGELGEGFTGKHASEGLKGQQAARPLNALNSCIDASASAATWVVQVGGEKQPAFLTT